MLNDKYTAVGTISHTLGLKVFKSVRYKTPQKMHKIIEIRF